jgi:hypothetical protein
LVPWIVVGLFVFGAATATYFKFKDTRRYGMIGRIVYEDNVIRGKLYGASCTGPAVRD